MRRVLQTAIAMVGVVCARVAHAEAAPEGEVANAKKQIEMTAAQMAASAFHIREDLRLTRKRGSKDQIACVDQALSRADVATRRVRETGEDTMNAYARGDIDDARAALRRVLELRELGRLASISSAHCTAALHVTTPTVTTVKMDIAR